MRRGILPSAPCPRECLGADSTVMLDSKGPGTLARDTGSRRRETTVMHGSQGCEPRPFQISTEHWYPGPRRTDARSCSSGTSHDPGKPPRPFESRPDATQRSRQSFPRAGNHPRQGLLVTCCPDTITRLECTFPTPASPELLAASSSGLADPCSGLEELAPQG